MTTTARVLSNRVTISVGAAAILTLLPSYIHSQYITGPIVNAVLLISAMYLGSTEAILLGFLPSLAALVSGLLPLALAPVIPFIMVSNSIYVYVYSKTAKWGIVSVAAASIAKYAFLSSVTYMYFSHLLPTKLLPVAQQMMSYPQLLTAVIGGLIAFSVNKFRR